MHFAFRVAALAAATWLAACGGSNDTPASANPPAQDLGAKLTGIVAVGAPLADAKVESWCASGEAGPSSIVSAGGSYELQMPAGCTGPWVLRASQGGTVLFSYGGEAAAVTVQLNITSLTDLVVRMSIEEVNDPDFAARSAALPPNLGQEWRTRSQQAINLVNSWRDAALPEVTVAAAFTQPFIPAVGDPMDDLLEFLQRARGSLSLEALVEQFAPRGDDLAGGQPWKTAFGAASTLSLSGSSCTSSGNPAAPATVTLRMQDHDLSVELASADIASPVAFTIGPAVRSDFQMVLRGSDPYVRVTASSAGGNSVQLFSDGGTPKIAFAAPGVSTVVCTLDTPVRRADLVAFQPAARIRKVVPAAGASGTCAASASGPAYTYAITSMGDVRFNGTSLPRDWLDAPHAYYSESLQFGFGGPGVSFQVQLSALATEQGIQPYYFSTVPYGLNCTSSNI